MNTLHSSDVTPYDPRKVQVFSLENDTNQLMNLGDRRGWNCAVLGQAPMPTSAFQLGEWWVVPAHEDTSKIPSRAMQRIQTIFEVGIRPKGFVIVHEAPKILTGPVEEPAKPSRQLPDLKTAGKDLAIGAVGLAGFALLLVSAVAAAAAIAIPAALLAGAVMIDPILIAVMEDDTWIEIDRWDTAV